MDEDGIYIINVISALSGEKSEFFRAEYKTIKQKFKNVYVFPITSMDKSKAENVQNIVIVATKKKIDIDKIMKDIKDENIKELLSHRWIYEIETDNIKTLTDDFAPVNFYALKHCLSN